MTDTTTAEVPTPAQQVHAAALFLDEHGPEGWRERVNLDTLNMGSLSNCILGQLYRDYPGDAWAYGRGLDLLFPGKHGYRLFGARNDDDIETFGFTDNVFADWDAEWRAELTEATG